MLTDSALEQFKTLFETEIGGFSDEMFRRMAIDLLVLTDTVYRPVKKSWIAEFSVK